MSPLSRPVYLVRLGFFLSGDECTSLIQSAGCSKRAVLLVQFFERSGSALRYAAAAATMAVVDAISAASASLLKVFFQNVAAAMVQKLKAIAPAMVPAHTLGEVVVAAFWEAGLPSAGPLPASLAAALAAVAAAECAAAAAAAAAAAVSGVALLAASVATVAKRAASFAWVEAVPELATAPFVLMLGLARGPLSAVVAASALAASSPPAS